MQKNQKQKIPQKVKRRQCIVLELSDYSSIDGMPNLPSATFNSRQVVNKFKQNKFEVTHIQNPTSEQFTNSFMKIRDKLIQSNKASKYFALYVQGMSRFKGDHQIDQNNVKYSDFEVLFPDNKFVNIGSQFKKLMLRYNIYALFFQDCLSLDQFNHGKVISVSQYSWYNSPQMVVFVSQKTSDRFYLDNNHAWCTTKFIASEISAIKLKENPNTAEDYQLMKEQNLIFTSHLTCAQNVTGYRNELKILEDWLKQLIQEKPKKIQIIPKVILPSINDVFHNSFAENQYVELKDMIKISKLSNFKLFELPPQLILKDVIVKKSDKQNRNQGINKENKQELQYQKKCSQVLLYNLTQLIFYDTQNLSIIKTFDIDDETNQNNSEDDKKQIQKVLLNSKNDLYVITTHNTLLTFTKIQSEQLILREEQKFNFNQQITDFQMYNITYFAAAIENGFVYLLRDNSDNLNDKYRFTLLQKIQVFKHWTNISSIYVNYRSSHCQSTKQNIQSLIILVGVDQKDSQGKKNSDQQDAPQVFCDEERRTFVAVKGTIQEQQFSFVIETQNLIQQPITDILTVGDTIFIVFKNQKVQTYSLQTNTLRDNQIQLDPFQPCVAFSLKSKSKYVSTHNNQITLRLDVNKRFTLFRNYFNEFEFQGGITWTQNDQILVLATKENEGTFFAVFDIDQDLKQYLYKLP